MGKRDGGKGWFYRCGGKGSSQKMPKPDKALILLIIPTSHPKC